MNQEESLRWQTIPSVLLRKHKTILYILLEGNDPHGVFAVVDAQTPSRPKNAHLKRLIDHNMWDNRELGT